MADDRALFSMYKEYTMLQGCGKFLNSSDFDKEFGFRAVDSKNLFLIRLIVFGLKSSKYGRPFGRCGELICSIAI